MSYTHTHTHTHTHTTYEALYQCPAKPDVTCYNGNAKRLEVMVMVMFLPQLRKSRLRKFK